MKKTIAGIVIAGGILLVGFQNCAKMNFSSNTGAPLEKGQGTLVPMADDNSGNSTSTTPPAAPSSDDLTDGPETDTEYGVCILQGSGNSMKLGLLSDKLEGVTSVAETVCITRKACTEYVSKSFEVKGSANRGFCKPEVKHLNDAMVKQLLGI